MLTQFNNKSQPVDLEEQFGQLFDQIQKKFEAAGKQALDAYMAATRKAQEELAAAHKAKFAGTMTAAQSSEFIAQAELKYRADWEAAGVLRKQADDKALADYKAAKAAVLADLKAAKAAAKQQQEAAVSSVKPRNDAH